MAAAAAANRAMEQSRLEEEKLRVQTKEKKDQSNIFPAVRFHSRLIIAGANASVEVKSHLKTFLRRRLQREGKSG